MSQFGFCNVYPLITSLYDMNNAGNIFLCRGDILY